MNLETAITKEVFETHVPAAKMPERNDSVFNRLEEQFSMAYNKLVEIVIGSDYVETVESDAAMNEKIVKFVCIYAFVRAMRSLDLVLTSTGFGVVSTNNTAPASKLRVDALEEELRQQLLTVQDEILIYLTTVTGWGNSSNAKRWIDNLFFRPGYIKEFTIKKFTSESWQQARGLSVTADGFLRKVVSDEYMDELLVKTRTATLENIDIIIIEKCNRFTGAFISGYETDKMPNKHMLDAIMEYLETYSTAFTTYSTSKLYQYRHAERFENQKEDPSFFFM